MSEVQIENSWKEQFQKEFDKPYFLNLKEFLLHEKKLGHTIYPPGNKIFAAFNKIPFDDVKVVILGQDPYHGSGQANGFCFSVDKGIKEPPSLKNIFKELKSDMGYSIPNHGDLSPWANQGVLLLNATLTVRANQAGSHQQKGWETFTDAVIKTISEKRNNLVFLLWGKFAQSKQPLIDENKHLVLFAAHPSPFSAYNGFFGCRHFSRTNAYLANHGMKIINWQL